MVVSTKLFRSWLESPGFGRSLDNGLMSRMFAHSLRLGKCGSWTWIGVTTCVGLSSTCSCNSCLLLMSRNAIFLQGTLSQEAS